jgi:hypothetical protein
VGDDNEKSHVEGALMGEYFSKDIKLKGWYFCYVLPLNIIQVKFNLQRVMYMVPCFLTDENS